MSVARCKREVSSREFLEWQVFLSIDPQGESAHRIRHAELMAATYNGSGNIKKPGGGTFNPREFIHDPWRKYDYKDATYQKNMFMQSMQKAKAIASTQRSQKGKENG